MTLNLSGISTHFTSSLIHELALHASGILNGFLFWGPKLGPLHALIGIGDGVRSPGEKMDGDETGTMGLDWMWMRKQEGEDNNICAGP